MNSNRIIAAALSEAKVSLKLNFNQFEVVDRADDYWVLVKELREWLTTNVGQQANALRDFCCEPDQTWMWFNDASTATFYFKHKSQAMMFKLAFGGA